MPVTTIKVLVRKDFELGKAGETIEMSPLEAAIWDRKGFVNVSKQPTIQTRDMQADEPATVTPRRRQYRRRDLTAEE